MRLAERSTLLVVAVEIGIPVSWLAWRYSLRHASPALAENLVPTAELVPWLVVPLGVLVWATLRRLRRGFPPWWCALPVLAVQLAGAAAGEVFAHTTLLALMFACTALIVLRGPWSWLVFAMAMGAELVVHGVTMSPTTLGLVLHDVLAGLAIYAVVRTGELTLALRGAQTQLAGFAVVRERARMARDLHDTLGQQLTTIGLRAELASQLVVADPPRAAAEIRLVQRITERAVNEMRQVARGECRLEFAEEVADATTLLEELGVQCRVTVIPVPDDEVAGIAGWVVREAVTNVLRHSAAHHCLIDGHIRAGGFRLTVENDGVVGSVGPPGAGLAGISARVATLGGQVRHGPVKGGLFRVVVDLPMEDGR